MPQMRKDARGSSVTSDGIPRMATPLEIAVARRMCDAIDVLRLPLRDGLTAASEMEYWAWHSIKGKVLRAVSHAIGGTGER